MVDGMTQSMLNQKKNLIMNTIMNTYFPKTPQRTTWGKWLMLLLLCTVSATAWAQEPGLGYRIDPASPIEVFEGETFTVDVVVETRNSPSISSQSIYLTYNSSVINLLDYEEVAVENGLFSAGLQPQEPSNMVPLNPQENDQGFAYAALYIPTAGPTNVQEKPYVLLTLTFDVVGVDGDQTNLAFENVDGIRTNLALETGGGTENLVTNLEDALITVKKPIVPTPPPPALRDVGGDRLDICGSTIRLGNTNDVTGRNDYIGSWRFVTNPAGKEGSLSDENAFNPVLFGEFGATYELEWVVTEVATGAEFPTSIVVSFAPDADLPGGLGDGVQDCVDICLGGDDSQNSDQAGLPDDCDCNPFNAETEFREVDFIPASKVIQADFELALKNLTITADDGAVEAYAGRKVTIGPGNHFTAGSNVRVYIDDCFEEPVQLTEYIDDNRPGMAQAAPSIAIDRADLQVIPTVAESETLVRLQLPEDQSVQLRMFNQNGQLVRTFLDNTVLQAGQHDYQLELASFQAGMYFIRMTSGDSSFSKRLIIVKR